MLAGIIALFANTPAVDNLLHGKAYEDALPRDFSLPAVVIHRYNGTQEYDYNGPVDVEEVNVQVDIYGKTATQRDQLRTAIKNLLDSFVGTLPDGTVVQGCFLDRTLDPPYTTTADSKNAGFRGLLGYRVVSKRM